MAEGSLIAVVDPTGLRPDEQGALNQPWAVWVRRATLEALQRLQKRKRLGQIIARIRAILKSSRQNSSEIRKREVEISGLHRSAAHEKAIAVQLTAEAAKVFSAAVSQQLQASAAATAAAASAYTAKREQLSLQREISASQHELAGLRPQITRLEDRQKELLEAQALLVPTIQSLEQHRQQIASQTMVATSDLAALKGEKAKLKRAKDAIDREQRAQRYASQLLKAATQKLSRTQHCWPLTSHFSFA
jgi:chromosome segregation ATPase